MPLDKPFFMRYFVFLQALIGPQPQWSMPGAQVAVELDGPIFPISISPAADYSNS